MPSIFNSRDVRFKTPFGALAEGQAVTFTLWVPQNYACKTPVLFIQPDGSGPQRYSMAPCGTENGADGFTVTLTPGAPGLYFYWFDLWVDFKKLYMGMGGDAVVSSSNDGRKYPLTVYDAGFSTPEAARAGVMYQIFPDRFFEGDPDKPHVFGDRVYRRDKHNPPYFWGEVKSYGNLTQDYYGGDFSGIIKRLPYLFSIGVNWLYLNPIFEAHSNHRYNTANYLKADPTLGTNEDFARLCTEAGKYGIRIILDGVFSHTGSDSIYFNKEGRYPGCGAFQGPESPYRGWFNFLPGGGYKSWWGFETLPECNKQNPAFRRFITGEGGVIDYWLGLGAAGFRLDVADELPDDFIAEIRAAVKRNGEDKLLIGEVWEDAALKEAYGVRRQYFLGRELDGVMNYPFRTAILQYLQNFDAPSFADAVMAICENYPPPALHNCTTHLSTHDTERIITALAGDAAAGHGRGWQSGHRLSREQYHLGIVRMRLAMALQFTLPGIPCVYYGDEIAMQGYADPFNRSYFNWESGEDRLIPLMMRLAALRKACCAFHGGSLAFIRAKGGVLHYRRSGGGEEAEIAVNCGGWPVLVSLLGEEIRLPVMDFSIRATNYDFAPLE